jgi:mannose/cellobiose epimerase-like protein (N-acyl-D-glucosamine 2-epimerase family)
LLTWQIRNAASPTASTAAGIAGSRSVTFWRRSGSALAAERGIGRVPDYARYAANYRSLDAGYDERRGGFFFALVADATRYRDDRKFWWVQAEAIVCSLHLALFAADKLALDRLRATLRWIEKRHVDRRHGEWHQQPRRLFVRPDPKADNWKTADHPGRALIESLRLLGND